MADVDAEEFEPGELVVRLFSNAEAVYDGADRVDAFFVMIGDESDEDVDIAAFVDRGAAERRFRRALM